MARAIPPDQWERDGLSPARGIGWGLLISIPIWLLIIGGLLILLGKYA